MQERRNSIANVFLALTHRYTLKLCLICTHLSQAIEYTIFPILCLSGDILVYDVKPSTWQPLRLIHNEALGDDGVIDLAWSRDGAFFMTLSQMVSGMHD